METMMSAGTWRAIVRLLFVAAAVPQVAGAQLEQRLRIWSCPQADSLLGPIGADTNGIVFLRHVGKPDTAIYRTGATNRDPEREAFVFFSEVDVAIPGLLPDAQAYVVLRGDAALRLSQAAASPSVSVLLDDDPRRKLTMVTRGKYVGPAGSPVHLPVTVGFLSEDLLAVARAQLATIRVGDVDIVVTDEDRVDVRSLVRTTMCEMPRNAEQSYAIEYQQSDTTDSRVTPGTWFAWEVEEFVSVLPKQPGLRYPEQLRNANVEGYVIVRFEVDTLGRADMKTFRTMQTSNEGFSRAVRDWLLVARFKPARRAGRPVRQWVQQQFNFSLTGTPAIPDHRDGLIKIGKP